MKTIREGQISSTVEQCSKCFFVWDDFIGTTKCPQCGGAPLTDHDELDEDEGEAIHA